MRRMIKHHKKDSTPAIVRLASSERQSRNMHRISKCSLRNIPYMPGFIAREYCSTISVAVRENREVQLTL